MSSTMTPEEQQAFMKEASDTISATNDCGGEPNKINILDVNDKKYVLEVDKNLPQALQQQFYQNPGDFAVRAKCIDGVCGFGGSAMVFAAILSCEGEKWEVVCKIVQPQNFDQDKSILLGIQMQDYRFFSETYFIVDKIRGNFNGIQPSLCGKNMSILRREQADAAAAQYTVLFKNNEKNIARIMLGACIALKVLHDQGTVHRDIKKENIFMRESNGNHVSILGDFGVFAYENAPGIQGSPYYISPRLAKLKDLIHTANYTFAEESSRQAVAKKSDDIWALGIVFHWLLFNQSPVVPYGFDITQYNPNDHPFKAKGISAKDFSKYQKILDGFNLTTSVDEGPSEQEIKTSNKQLIDLIGKMLVLREDKIITINEVIIGLYKIATSDPQNKKLTHDVYSDKNLVDRKSGMFGLVTPSNANSMPFNLKTFVKELEKKTNKFNPVNYVVIVASVLVVLALVYVAKYVF